MRTPCRIAMSVLVTLGAFSTCGAFFTDASAADVRIGVNVGIPAPVIVAPPVVIMAPPPPVVVAPGTPTYFYGGNYFTFYQGAWFMAPRHGGPWAHSPGPPPWERHPRARHWREGHVHGGWR